MTPPPAATAGRWVVIALLAGGLAIALFVQRFRVGLEVVTERALEVARHEQTELDVLRPETRIRGAEKSLWPGAWQLGCIAESFDAVSDAGGWALATSAGLLLVPAAGKPVRLIDALHGLPAARVSCLARYADALWMGTEGGGLAAWKDGALHLCRFHDPGLDRVTALAVSGDRLYVGTFGGGVFFHDGRTFRRFRATAPGAAISRVTALCALRSGIAIGTAEHGVLVSEAGSQTVFGAPFDRVTALGAQGDDLLVGTPYALQRIDRLGHASTDLPDAHVTAIGTLPDGAVLAGTFEGEVLRLEPGRRSIRPPAESGANPSLYHLWRKLSGSVRAFAVAAGKVVAATGAGSFRLDGREPALLAQAPGLRHPHVSALALDPQGALWAGYFDGGVDRLEADSRVPRPVATLAQCPGVNHLRWDARSGRMLISTLHGFFASDGATGLRRLRAADGLIGENVSFTLPVEDRLLFCTEKGLSVETNGRIESISVFHGLPNNHVFCAALHDGRVGAGTLGGLAFLDGLQVLRSVTASPKGLPASWVTALLSLPGGLLAGTYGGGCALLGPDGTWTPHPEKPSRFEVNPNALLQIGNRVAAGTLDRGVLLFPAVPGTGPATPLLEGLGHPDATALACDGRFLYVATEAGITALPTAALP
ncbi:MAG: hypothetical protein HY303_03495 [Candidatus Wallbacteria bacterium]|nr:hypothetical protein [Candidatus Wallbacteria bacterium]